MPDPPRNYPTDQVRYRLASGVKNRKSDPILLTMTEIERFIQAYQPNCTENENVIITVTGEKLLWLD